MSDIVDIYLGEGIPCKRCDNLFISRNNNFICRECYKEIRG